MDVLTIEPEKQILEQPIEKRGRGWNWRQNLKPFQPGQRVPGAGRPKGSKSATTLLIEAAPRGAKAYLKKVFAGDSAVLIDYRKAVLLPDAESVSPTTKVVIFIGDSSLLPRLPSLPSVLQEKLTE